MQDNINWNATAVRGTDGEPVPRRKIATRLLGYRQRPWLWKCLSITWACWIMPSTPVCHFKHCPKNRTKQERFSFLAESGKTCHGAAQRFPNEWIWNLYNIETDFCRKWFFTVVRRNQNENQTAVLPLYSHAILKPSTLLHLGNCPLQAINLHPLAGGYFFQNTRIDSLFRRKQRAHKPFWKTIAENLFMSLIYRKRVEQIRHPKPSSPPEDLTVNTINNTWGNQSQGLL